MKCLGIKIGITQTCCANKKLFNQLKIFQAGILLNKLYSLYKSHCVKWDRTRSFSGPYFPAFELNLEILMIKRPFLWRIIDINSIRKFIVKPEAATRGVLCKTLFLEISQNSQENTCARVSFLMKLQASGQQKNCEISKNTFSYRTTLVAASVFSCVEL